jgi:glycosyltransferase involved in cell wall biosynthesis
MRIALVIYGSLEAISGGFLYDRKLVEYLRRQGEEVEVISLPWRSYAIHLADNLSAELARRLAQLDVDILLQDELNHPSLFWLNRRIRRGSSQPRIPLVAVVHHLRSSELHPAWLLTLYRWVERLYLLSLNGLIYNSQTTRRSVARLTGQELPGVIAYPAGDQFQPEIDPAQIRTRALEAGPLRVLFVGNLIRRKGVHVLLAALRRMPPGAATLTVVGGASADPAYARSLRRQASAGGLSRSVAFLGPLQGAELAAQYRQHQVLAVPSSYEGFGIAYLEGMGFGLPAVATDRGAAGEVITHGENGFRVPPGDVDALQEILLQLAQQREILAAMGQSARQRFLRHPTWEQTGAVIHAYLKGML